MKDCVMGSKRLTPTIVGKIASKRFVAVVVLLSLNTKTTGKSLPFLDCHKKLYTQHIYAFSMMQILQLPKASQCIRKPDRQEKYF